MYKGAPCLAAETTAIRIPQDQIKDQYGLGFDFDISTAW